MSRWTLAAWLLASSLIFVILGEESGNQFVRGVAAGAATGFTLLAIAVLVTGAELRKKDPR